MMVSLFVIIVRKVMFPNNRKNENKKKKKNIINNSRLFFGMLLFGFHLTENFEFFYVACYHNWPFSLQQTKSLAFRGDFYRDRF